MMAIRTLHFITELRNGFNIQNKDTINNNNNKDNNNNNNNNKWIVKLYNNKVLWKQMSGLKEETNTRVL